jgi:site-specific recombinase XerD
MTAPRRPHTYNNGQPYIPPRGRYAPREAVGDHLSTIHPVVQGFPTAAEFTRTIVREMKIRFYQPKTIKTYRNALTGFLRWFGAPPHRVTREDIRDFLEILVDGGASSSWVGVHLAAFRTAFDKMCGRQVTLGLETPRRPKRMPVVPSVHEIRLMLEAVTSLRDKLLVGLLYALGVRVSEVVRLRYRDIDFERRVVTIWQGKGRVDRQVMLPVSFEPLLRHMAHAYAADDFLFPAKRHGRHISPRTVQRVVKNAARLADVAKEITPHCLRHAFATHLLENGTDIRFIQKYLGHAKLETTTIYTRVAVLRENRVTSPLDVLTGASSQVVTTEKPPQQVGCMALAVTPRPTAADEPRAADATVTIMNDPPVKLDGIVLSLSRPGWVSLELPPLEIWEQHVRWLTQQQRERITSPDFYQHLQKQLGDRFLRLLE